MEISSSKVCLLFSGLTGWFSSTVGVKYKILWEQNGGNISGLKEAQYLFSESATGDDIINTTRSYTYFTKRWAILHPLFIMECLDKGNLHQVAIGSYQIISEDLERSIINYDDQIRIEWRIFKQLIDQEQRRKFWICFLEKFKTKSGEIDMVEIPESPSQLKVIDGNNFSLMPKRITNDGDHV